VRKVIAMSKLADAMRKAARPEARAIGFAATSAKANPTMLVIARAGSAADVRKSADQGADCVITASATLSDAGKAVWGSEAPMKDRGGAQALVKSGADFLVFDDETTDAAVLLEEDLGYVMRIAFDAPDTFLRTVEGMPLDALLLPPLDSALTVRRTLDLRRIATFARKPLLLPVENSVEPAVLEALRDCGVIGVIAEGAAGVTALRPKVDGLVPRRKAKDARSVQLAPSGSGFAVRVDEDGSEQD
jgi:hypothetical protein